MKISVEITFGDTLNSSDERIYEAVCNALMGPNGCGVREYYGDDTTSNKLVAEVKRIEISNDGKSVWGCLA